MIRYARSCLNWFRSLFHRTTAERDLREELAFHVEREIAQNNSAEVSCAEGRRQALCDFGGVAKFNEERRDARGTTWLREASQDLRFALRLLRKSPGFAVVTVLTLALGIGANTAMFSIVNAWLLRPLALKNPQELVSVWRTQAQAPRQPAYFDFYHDYLVWASQTTSLQSLAATFEQTYALTGAGEPRELHGAVATWNFFQTIGASPELGRFFEPDDAHRASSCIIGHTLWAAQFHSSPDIIGRAIRLNRKSYRVIGVLPAKFSFRILDRPFETDAWTVITDAEKDYTSSSSSPVAVIGRLKSGITAAQAEADLSTLQLSLNRQFPDEPEHSGILVVNLQQDNTREIRGSLLMLLAAVAVLLLIACVNTASLILGRNAQRTPEFALRVALGCGTSRLLRQLTAEILAIFALGGFVGLLLAFALLRTFAAWNPFDVLPPGGYSLDAMVLLAAVALVSLTALVFGSLPAFWALHALDGNLLAAQARATTPRSHLRSRGFFVATQICLSVVLLVGASLLIATFRKMSAEPLGFHTRDVFVASIALPDSTYPTAASQNRFSQTLLATLRESPRMRYAGSALSWPFQVNGLAPVEIENRPAAPVAQLPQAADFSVGPGYFDALGVPLLRGRSFNEHDTADSLPVAVINEELARQFFPDQDPLGQRIRTRSRIPQTPALSWLTIVGVVGATRSIRYNHTQWDRYPALYASFLQRQDGSSTQSGLTTTLYVYLQTSALDAPAVRSIVRAIDPDLPLGALRSVDEVVGTLRSQPHLRAILTGGFALWTLLLTAVGVGGIVAEGVEQRCHDIGIRMALGAQPADVLRLVVGQGLKLALFGLIAGVALSIILTRLLSSFSQFLYGIRATDPGTLLAVSLLLTVVALLASYGPARRATHLDPLIALHHD